MKIAATMVGMDAAHTYTEVAFQPAGLFDSLSPPGLQEQSFNFGERFSTLISNTVSESTVKKPKGIDPPSSATDEVNLQDGQVNGQLIEELAGKIIGHSVSVSSSSMIQSTTIGVGLGMHQRISHASLGRTSIYHEQEYMQFSASGMVLTEDGREINFQFGLETNRRVSVVNGSAGMGLPFFIDPLVLNFGEGIPFSGDSFFSFDLDGDGSEEELACPGKGCGFLAFDRNLDGMINNGLELFGPATGFGFDELNQYDQDSNLWIDENDQIFDRLSVWMKDADGKEQLLSLKEAGVGAISIANGGTDCVLEDAAGNLVGRVKNSGIFLTEDGTPHSLQEIHLADQNTEDNSGREPPSYQFNEEIRVPMNALLNIIERQRLQLKLILAKKQIAEANEQFFHRIHSHLTTSSVTSQPPLTDARLDEIIHNLS